MKKSTMTEKDLALSKEISEALVLSENNSITEKSPGDIYARHLPEGVTVSVVNQIADYNARFVPIAAHAVGVVAVKAMAENKEIVEVSGVVKMGENDKAEYLVSRSRERTDHFHGNKPVIKKGHIFVDYSVKAGKHSPLLKEVRTLISELAVKSML
jgi:hypothetical protein